MTLNGDTVSAQLFITNDTTSPETATVGSGVEFPSLSTNSFPGAFSVDIEGDSFSITLTNFIAASAPFSIVLSDLDWVDDPNAFITAVSDPGITGITSSIGPNGDEVTIDIEGDSLSFDFGTFTGQTATFNLTTECFLTGTHILTDQGEVPVESLKIGDQVKTAEGKLETVKWVGHQTVDPNGPHHPFRTLPICIKAGALGNNLPTRDLYTSPDHALLVDGLLINAGALVNDITILKTEPKEVFKYHHIELEQHNLMVAEGTPAESYLPQNQARDTFDNGDEYEELYPNHNILSLLPMHFPRVSSQRQLPRCVSKKLIQIAETLPGMKVLTAV